MIGLTILRSYKILFIYRDIIAKKPHKMRLFLYTIENHNLDVL